MIFAGRGFLLMGIAVLSAGACSSSGVRAPAESNDAGQLDSDAAVSATVESVTGYSSVTTARSAHDAGGVSLSDSTWNHSASDASVNSSLGGYATSALTAYDSDASLILEPEFEELSVGRLCEQVASLEGRSVDVDLAGEFEAADWNDVDPEAASVEAGVQPHADAMACPHRFAPYVVPCRGSVLVVTAPTLAFGAGPTVGGEQVGFGCWEADCVGGCLPESRANIGKVRVRVAAPVNSRYDEALDVNIGQIRVHGVDVEGIAQLEVLARF